MAYGFLGHIGIAKETTWGTAVAATDYFEALSEGITAVPDRFQSRNIVGAMYEPDDNTGVVRISGPVTFPAHPSPFGHVLNGVFGNNSGSVVLSGFLFKNEFTVRASDTNSLHPLPAYTLEIFRDITSSQQYDGCQFANVQMAIQPNQELRVTAQVIGKGTQNIAKTTASFPGSPTGFFYWDSCSIALGGTGVSIIEALTITLDNALEGLPAIASTNSGEITRIKRNGPPTVRVSGSVALEDFFEYNKLIAQTEQRLAVHLTAANSFALLIEIPRMVYTEFPLGISGRERQIVSFNATGRYHTGSASMIKATLWTTKSDY